MVQQPWNNLGTIFCTLFILFPCVGDPWPHGQHAMQKSRAQCKHELALCMHGDANAHACGTGYPYASERVERQCAKASTR